MSQDAAQAVARAVIELIANSTRVAAKLLTASFSVSYECKALLLPEICFCLPFLAYAWST